jgi:hypothetical protein
MLYNCYLRNGIVYVPTVGKRGGVYNDIEPVAVVPVANTEALRRAFFDAISRKNVDLPLIKGKWPPPVLLKYAGVSAWPAFARGALTWNIDETDGIYRIFGHRAHNDGYWVRDPDQTIDFLPGTAVGDVVDHMIAILQASARRPQAG